MSGQILCAACGAEAPAAASTCPSCGAPPRLRDRYILEAIVGQGAVGVTYRARDTQTGARVAVKEMPLRHTDADMARRVEREARVLGELTHDRIPAYVEEFTLGAGKRRTFYLVQGFIDGPTLATEMKRRRYTEDDVLTILDGVCEVLGYLHGLMPPVVHRDLKPKNVIRRAGDGALVLIDFGAVRDVVADPSTGGSTVAGTYGYMAPEQFRGVATPQTDLYALGVLGVVLLSRRDPLELVRPDHSLAWRDRVKAGVGTVELIASLLEPEPAARPASAAEVRRRIARIRSGETVPAARPAQLPVPMQRATPVVRRTLAARSRATAILLAIVGAPWGVHNFYLGRTLRGVLSAAFFFTGIPTLVSIYDAIRMMFDGQRRFDLRFNPAIAELEDGRAAHLAEQIERLHDLKEKGALTDEEFDREKARLLGHHPATLQSLFETFHRGGLLRGLGELGRLPKMIEHEIEREFGRTERRKRRERYRDRHR